MTSSAPQTSTAKLAAQVAHELNNPLDAVLRFVSLAQRKSQAGKHSEVERHLADAQFGLERMAEVLRQLMELGRQTHEVLAECEPRAALPLGEVLQLALHTVAAQAEQKYVTLEVENGVPVGQEPRFDNRLAQVLANLLKNAVEAAPEQSRVRLEVSQASETTLEITVEDEGPGIAAELLPRLFMPFATTKGTGHGLGLVISRDLVAALQGTLKVQNRGGPEQGCIAMVVLPLPLVF